MSKTRENVSTTNALFMWPKIDKPYVYFTELEYRGEDFSLPYNRTLAYSIGRYAEGVMRTDRAEGEKHSEQMFKVQQSIDFLKGLASNERSKELRLMDYCISVVKKDYINESFKQQFENLKQNLNSNSVDYDQYISFINMLNASLQDIEDYKKRLNAIVSSETFFRSNNRALEHHMASQASTILNTLTSRRERFGTSQEGIITMLTLKFFQDGPGKNFLNDLMESSMTWGERGKRFTIATIIVEQELARYLHDNQKMNAYTQKEMGDKEFQRVYNELLAVVEKNVFETKNWNDLFLDSTLNESISEIFNITKLSYKLSPRAMKKENDPNKAARAMMESLGLTEILKNDILTNSVAHIKVQPQSQAVALYAEIASLIRSNIKSRGAHIGGKSAAVDLVRLIISPEKENETVNKSVNTFLKALKNFKFNTDEDDNHAQQLTKNFVEELNKLEKDLETVKNVFILHETTKLYRSIEGGKGFTGKFARGFKGRNINLITYINELIQIGESIGVNPQWLKFLAYNVTPGALESEHNKTYLESILAIAGGLIMFDDFGVMAQEIQRSNDIALKKTNNIHLYKLNEVYCPASFFLQMTANLLEEGLEYVSSEENSFSAEINPAAIAYDEPVADEEHPIKESTWTKYKTMARRSTIALYFAQNFLALVETLLNPTK